MSRRRAVASFGATIRAFRQAWGLSQRELSRRLQAAGLSVSPSYLSKIEHDVTRTQVSQEVVVGLANQLALQTQYMLDLAGCVDYSTLAQLARLDHNLALLLRRITVGLVEPAQIRSMLAAVEAARKQRKGQDA